MKNYEYPIDYTWSQDEMVAVISFLNVVEKAYEGGVSKEVALKAYHQFKKVVPGIGQEKQLSREFEKVSGYVVYDVMKLVRSEDGKKVVKIEQ